MTVGEIIEILSKLPPETKVLINEELGWYDLTKEDVEYMKVYTIWKSRYNGPNSAYECYSSTPGDTVYKSSDPNVEDYVTKTVGEEMAVLLG